MSELEADWCRVLDSSSKLVGSLERIEAAGGLGGLASTWAPARREKARASLVEACEELVRAIEQLGRQGKQPAPPRRATSKRGEHPWPTIPISRGLPASGKS